MTDQRPVTTTDAGIAAPSDAFAQSVGRNGPLLLQSLPVAEDGANRRQGWCQAESKAPVGNLESGCRG
jgi:hypothetical protein